jgi:large conductance mechanosensitive channel
MWKEFREFAMNGSVLDLAIGVVIGAAFGKIVDSLVQDVIMPPIGMLLQGVDFTNLFVTLKEGKVAGPYFTLAAAKEAGAVTMNLGAFINALISFLIVALAIFMVVRSINRMRRPPAPAPEAPPAPTPSEALLTEIRDLLKK